MAESKRLGFLEALEFAEMLERADAFLGAHSVRFGKAEQEQDAGVVGCSDGQHIATPCNACAGGANGEDSQ